MKYSNHLHSRVRPYSAQIERSELLPFRIRIVEDAQDLRGAVEIRSSAYLRHVPSVGRALQVAERDDFRSDVLLLIAERKVDRHVIGSVRVQPNWNEPLRIEGEAQLPEKFADRRLVEFMRLGVANGISGRLVTSALVKAGYEISHACSIDYVLVAGRNSVATMYRSMHFDDVLQGEVVQLSYADNVPHGIFAMPIADADRRWRESNHRLYSFMARTAHPDIEVDYDRVFEAFNSH